jgi:DNA-binding transcriptional ArsR family regulator
MLIAAPVQPLTITAKLFRGLAEPSRLAILECLRAGPRGVGAIVAATGLSQPNVSNHLACLHGCGLVSRRQEGRSVVYRLSDQRVDALLALADELLRDVAVGVAACARVDQSEETG